MSVKPLYGKNGWMFLDGDSNKTIEQMTGKLLLNHEQLTAWDDLLKTRCLKLAERDINYIFICAPNKESVYRKFLPDWYVPSELTPIHQLIPIFKKHLSGNFIYPLDALSDSAIDTYPIGDTHWNQYGAYKCYIELEKILGRTDTLGDIDFIKQDTPCDLGMKIYSNYTESLPVAKFKKNTCKMEFHNKIINQGEIIIFNNPDAPVKNNVVFFRDSFGSRLFHFLIRTYSRVVAIWQPSIDFNIINIEKPDLVISEQSERFLISPPSDSSALGVEELVLSKNRNANLYYTKA